MSASDHHSPRSDLLGGVAWVGFGALILIESLRMDRFTKMGASLYTMPGFTPGILGGVLVLLGIGLAWRGQRRALKTHREVSLQPLFNRRISLALPLCLIYAAGMIGRVPFWLATAMFVAAFTYCFTPGQIRPLHRIFAALASGALTSAIVIGVFQYVFLVRLP
jgi:hypothetical protein